MVHVAMLKDKNARLFQTMAMKQNADMDMQKDLRAWLDMLPMPNAGRPALLAMDLMQKGI